MKSLLGQGRARRVVLSEPTGKPGKDKFPNPCLVAISPLKGLLRKLEVISPQATAGFGENVFFFF